MKKLQKSIPIICIALLIEALSARAAELVPYELQAKIILKTLGYERSLAKGSGSLIIGVICDQDLKTANPGGDQIFEALKALDAFKVQNRPISVVKLTLRSLKVVDVLYLPSGLDKDLTRIIRHARDKGILTVTGESSYLEMGVTLGIFPKGEGRKGSMIVINLPAAEAEDTDFESRFLRVATVLE